MNSQQPRVSFGIINYNRLYYLMSCAESLMQSVEDYDNVEFICVDDNSSEPGTKEYLQTLEQRGWNVIDQQDTRSEQKGAVGDNNVDHLYPFIDALNIIHRKSTGSVVIPLQGDIQFVRKNWLSSFVQLLTQEKDVACIGLDAQRRSTLEASSFVKKQVGTAVFGAVKNRRIAPTGDSAYSKKILDKMDGWDLTGKPNPEDHFVRKFHRKFLRPMRVYLPWVPVAIAICTDPRGTNARVRGNKRYGKYWRAQNDSYYHWIDEKELPNHPDRPCSVEEVAFSDEVKLPLDNHGNWMKNPVDISTAGPADYEILV
jgi:glycosyltransferase involved in cell wall biosynthesis